MPLPEPALPVVDGAVRARLQALCDEGWDLWSRFDVEVRQDRFHPFVAANYEAVWQVLEDLRKPGLRFLEWGSATGVITILADLLGYDACGIELDEELVAVARDLAARHESRARFAAGSFVPEGYRWRPPDGDGRPGTIGEGASGYLQLGGALEEADVVFAFPWSGEKDMMLDIMRTYGGAAGVLLIHDTNHGTGAHLRGHPTPMRSWRPPPQAQ